MTQFDMSSVNRYCVVAEETIVHEQSQPAEVPTAEFQSRSLSNAPIGMDLHAANKYSLTAHLYCTLLYVLQ